MARPRRSSRRTTTPGSWPERAAKLSGARLDVNSRSGDRGRRAGRLRVDERAGRGNLVDPSPPVGRGSSNRERSAVSAVGDRSGARSVPARAGPTVRRARGGLRRRSSRDRAGRDRDPTARSSVSRSHLIGALLRRPGDARADGPAPRSPRFEAVAVGSVPELGAGALGLAAGLVLPAQGRADLGVRRRPTLARSAGQRPADEPCGDRGRGWSLRPAAFFVHVSAGDVIS